MFVSLLPGTILQNRYRIVSRLDKPQFDGRGKGGMGAVYLAEDSWLSCEVAVKQIFLDDIELSDDIAKAFQREAKLLANLRHPALPRVTSHFIENNGQFLVMDLIRGEDLDDIRLQHNGCLPFELALKLADQLLEVLDYLHSQAPPVIHRDIKPSNLKLTKSGQIMLLDFGLAKGTLGLMTQHNRSLFAMTPAYAPPEQIEGEITEARSDLFSFGATFYELLTGQPPPHALTKRALEIVKKNQDPLRPIHEFNPEVPAAVSDIFTSVLSLDLENRPASAALLRKQLADASADASNDKTTVIKRPFIPVTTSSPVYSQPKPENSQEFDLLNKQTNVLTSHGLIIGGGIIGLILSVVLIIVDATSENINLIFGVDMEQNVNRGLALILLGSSSGAIIYLVIAVKNYFRKN